jgi:hypothetical protein
MKLFKKTIQIYIVSVLFLTLSCSQYHVQLSNAFVERLNAQIKSGNFEQIYNESSLKAKESISKQEFIESMQIAVGKMKEIDESLKLQKDERISFDKSLFHEKNFAYRHIKKSGKELGVNIEIGLENGKLKLQNFCIFSLNEYLLQDLKINICVTNAKGKI